MSALPAPDAACPRCGCRNREVVNLPHQLACGAILSGKYWIGGVLGQGGFGITYMGYDLTLGIKVAIKEYYPNNIVSRSQPENAVQPVHDAFCASFSRGRERFLEEARSLARFSSERGVVNVREFFLANNTAYIVMDFVDGKTLKAVASESGGKLPARRVLEMLRPVIRTLAHIHESGLVHRDISPDNIILRPDGTAVLIDFGAARQISASGSKSLTINVKHGYAPEEQYRRRGKQGPWTDVYALCATIYRLTTGKKPPQALDRLVSEDPLIPPDERGADLTPAQQRAIMKGLSVHAEDRPQDMRELYELLYRGAGGPIGFLQRIWTEKRSVLLVGLAAIAAVVAALFALHAVKLEREAAARIIVATPEPAGFVSPVPTIAPTPTANTEILSVSADVSTPAPEPARSPEPTVEPTVSPALERPGTVGSNQLLVRREPSRNSDALATLRRGDVVELINKQGEFYYVWSPEFMVRGYVLSEYIESEYALTVPKVKVPATPTPLPTPKPTPEPGTISVPTDSSYAISNPTLPPYAVHTPPPGGVQSE